MAETNKSPRQPTAREQDILDESFREFAQLQTWRHTFAAHWEEVANLILPESRNTFEYGNFNWPGAKKTDRQIDATGMMALHKFAAICNSLLTPKNMIWHGLRASDDYVMKDRATRLWFEQATKILFRLRYAPYSGFAGQITDCYTQLGAFGTKGMFVDEFDTKQHPFQKGIRYKSIPLGELFIRQNHQGIVDGFIRWFRLTALQAYQQFGEESFPEILRAPLAAQSQTPYNFLHRVCPRSDYDRERLDARGKPWASYYISIEGKSLLSEGGYRKFPAAISRYSQAPGEVYGRSPAMMVLPSLKTINAQKRTFLKQGHRAADPVLLTTDDGILDGASIRPGSVNKGGMSPDGKPLVGVLPSGNIQINEKMMEMETALIQDAFLVNLFQLALNLKDLPQMTATQVIEITNQKGILLAPTVGNQEDDLGHMIEREIDIAMNLGMLPPMPPRLREAKGEYTVEYTSPLSKAARAQNASGFMRAVEFSKELINITQDQSHLDWADMEVAMPEIADIMGAPPSWTASEEKMQKKREARASAMQEQMQTQRMPAEAAMIKANAVAAKAGMVPPAQAPAQPGPPLTQGA
ncbi:MAG TPA: portal protein [Burkholderiales bacterium]|nr:portal protein [Burkholderiales bacterium]